MLGFDDQTLQPVPCKLAEDVNAAYHVDRIQGLISSYAFDPFPVEVVFGDRNGQRHPIIAIPEGVQVPVVSKSALVGIGGRKLISEGALYFRTLSANGTSSTAQILPRDYRALLDICFDNREADIGRFLRRQLGGTDLTRLVQQLTPAEAPPDLQARTQEALNRGAERFLGVIAEREKAAELENVRDFLTMEVAAILDPSRANALATREFYRTIASANPQLTGWPIWLDSSTFHDASQRPYVKDGGWEALLVDLHEGWGQHFEFMRFEPAGEFFLRRVMQEDLSGRVQSRAVLDPFLMVYRVAETLVVGLRIARALGWSADAAAGFAFRWSGLTRRSLSSWANPMRFVASGGTSQTGMVQTYVEVPIATPETSIAPLVAHAVGPLLAAFDGYTLTMEVYEDLCRRLVERRMD